MVADMTNLAMTRDIPFGDEQAFNDFLGMNEIAHQTIVAALQRRGVEAVRIPLTSSPMDNPEWLLDHYTMHQSECSALGIPVPDIAAVDLTNEAQFHDWMLTHAQLHEAENVLLGIFT